jgi:hypothetical protein
MADPPPAVRKQIERLQAALAQDGDEKQAASIAGILATAKRVTKGTPSRIERSKSQSAGETLGPKTPIPVDRETAAALAEVIFPADISPRAPFFNLNVTQAIGKEADTASSPRLTLSL